MFVHKARHHEVVRRSWQARVRDICEIQGRKHISCTRTLQHLGRNIDTVDCSHTFTREPRGGATGAAANITAALNAAPRNSLKFPK
jgi:hypothetical protein